MFGQFVRGLARRVEADGLLIGDDGLVRALAGNPVDGSRIVADLLELALDVLDHRIVFEADRRAGAGGLARHVFDGAGGHRRHETRFPGLLGQKQIVADATAHQDGQNGHDDGDGTRSRGRFFSYVAHPKPETTMPAPWPDNGAGVLNRAFRTSSAARRHRPCGRLAPVPLTGA